MAGSQAEALDGLERSLFCGPYGRSRPVSHYSPSPALAISPVETARRIGTLPRHVLDRLDLDADGCLLWFGACSDGWGRVLHEGRSWAAHRLVWTVVVGPLASRDVHLHHTCGNRRCVLPQHLVPVTRREHRRAHGAIF